MPEPGWKPAMIFWDLDGTLAYWSSLRIIGHVAWAYARRLAREVPFLTGVLAAARAYRRMMDNPGPLTNDRYFNSLMASSLGKTDEQMACATREILASGEVEQAVGWFIRPILDARALLQKVIDDGRFRNAVATSPVMPSGFNRKRLAMVGFSPRWFEHVTGSDLYSSRKDSTRFYRELLAHVGLPAEACLMVGNDPAKDLVAKTAGIAVFLLRTGHTRARQPPPDLRPDWEGGYDDLAGRLGLEPK